MERRHPALLLISFLLLLGAACHKKEKIESAAAAAPEEQPEFVMSPFRIQAFGGPGIEWELRAPQARAYTSMNIMRAEQIDLTLFENGKKSTAITSDRGVFCIQNEVAIASPKPGKAPPVIQAEGTQLQAGDMLLSGNVVVISTDGSKLTTDWVHFSKAGDIIESTAPVQIVRADSVTNGTGLKATPDLRRVQIFNQTLTIKDDDEKK
jgi:lipopolysaccharide export system protein LptC